MTIESIRAYIEDARPVKYAGLFSVRYVSPVSGKKRRLNHRVTGSLKSREEAQEWIRTKLPSFVKTEIETARRQEWRHAVEIVKLASQYKAYKKHQAPRSWQQETSFLENYVLPYFVAQMGLRNPNLWQQEHQKFKAWLLEGARTEKGALLAVSSANKAINALNKFSEWMRDHVRALEWANFRSLKSYPQSLQNRKGADDLVDDEEFNQVLSLLKDEIFSDMFRVQRHTGMRVNEILGLSLSSLTAKIPEEIEKHFQSLGFNKIVGAIYLDSQPRDPYITRINGEIPRKPLKWRNAISPKEARTIPIFDREIWNILVSRFKVQKFHFENNVFGIKKESYLLFDGAQRNLYLVALRGAYEKVGLRFKGSHCLRHTRATELSLLGVSKEMREITLGHKGMAQERYDHIVEVLNRRSQQSKDFEGIEFI